MTMSLGAQKMELAVVLSTIACDTERRYNGALSEKVFSNPLLLEKIFSHLQEADIISMYRLRRISSAFNEVVLNYLFRSPPPYLALERLRLGKEPWFGFPLVSKGNLENVDSRLFRGVAVDFEVKGALATMTQTLAKYGSLVTHLRLLNVKEKEVLLGLEAVKIHCPNLKDLQMTLIRTGGDFVKPPQRKTEVVSKALTEMTSLDISVVRRYGNFMALLCDYELRPFGDFIEALPNLQRCKLRGLAADLQTLSRLPIYPEVDGTQQIGYLNLTPLEGKSTER